jgi:hypothetical protein
MAQLSAVNNPFILLLNPEVVLAAIEKSEHLSQLNRHLCRPLDRQTPASSASNDEVDDAAGTDSVEDAETAN